MHPHQKWRRRKGVGGFHQTEGICSPASDHLLKLLPSPRNPSTQGDGPAGSKGQTGSHSQAVAAGPWPSLASCGQSDRVAAAGAAPTRPNPSAPAPSRGQRPDTPQDDSGAARGRGMGHRTPRQPSPSPREPRGWLFERKGGSGGFSGPGGPREAAESGLL